MTQATVDTTQDVWDVASMTHELSARLILDAIIEGHDDAADAIFDYLIEDGRESIADLGTALCNVTLMALNALGDDDDAMVAFMVSMGVCPTHHDALESCGELDLPSCRKFRKAV